MNRQSKTEFYQELEKTPDKTRALRHIMSGGFESDKLSSSIAAGAEVETLHVTSLHPFPEMSKRQIFILIMGKY